MLYQLSYVRRTGKCLPQREPPVKGLRALAWPDPRAGPVGYLSGRKVGTPRGTRMVAGASRYSAALPASTAGSKVP